MSKQAYKRVRKALHLEVNREPLPAYAWPGGYQLFYMFADCECCCPDCVNKEIALIDDAIKTKSDEQWQLVAVDVNYEDNDMYCCHCNEKIPASYGE